MWKQIDFARPNNPLTRIAAAGALALALAGCNEIAAQRAAPIRPVLVAAVHYEAQARDRSFVGTVRPRIESDLGFRVGGKVLKRLVEVGAMVKAGTPLATLDEVDLKLQAEQAEAELTRGNWRTRAGERRRSPYQRVAAKGLVDRRPIGPGQSGRR
jgi:multidrug efflux pump subunit AcrA (membrane-fusion protein)